MNRPILLGLVAAAAAWWVVRRSNASRRIPVQEAAERLRQAWANNHTIA